MKTMGGQQTDLENRFNQIPTRAEPHSPQR
nr:MAG TPA: hypothetical protein [Caudoviricetes sp.]